MERKRYYNKSVAKFTKFDFIQSLNINKLNTKL